jgi:hypothetical protein
MICFLDSARSKETNNPKEIPTCGFWHGGISHRSFGKMGVWGKENLFQKVSFPQNIHFFKVAYTSGFTRKSGRSPWITRMASAMASSLTSATERSEA